MGGVGRVSRRGVGRGIEARAAGAGPARGTPPEAPDDNVTERRGDGEHDPEQPRGAAGREGPGPADPPLPARVGRRARRDDRGERLPTARRRWARVPRRHRRIVARPDRTRKGRDRRGRGGADETSGVLHGLLGVLERSGDRAGRAARRPRPHPARSRLLHERRLRGQRGGDQDGALLPSPPRGGGAQLDPRPAQRVPRDRLRVRLGQRSADLPRGVRADAAPRAPPDAAVAVSRRAVRRSRPHGLLPRRARAHDRGDRARPCRRDDR